MTRNKYLELLKTDFGKKPLPEELTKMTKMNFVSFGGSDPRPVSVFSPPYDAEGVACGLCPTCHRGEFWRRPKFHKDHDPRGWVCWFCSPPPEDPYTCDFCGVPEENERIRR